MHLYVFVSVILLQSELPARADVASVDRESLIADAVEIADSLPEIERDNVFAEVASLYACLGDDERARSFIRRIEDGDKRLAARHAVAQIFVRSGRYSKAKGIISDLPEDSVPSHGLVADLFTHGQAQLLDNLVHSSSPDDVAAAILFAALGQIGCTPPDRQMQALVRKVADRANHGGRLEDSAALLAVLNAWAGNAALAEPCYRQAVKWKSQVLSEDREPLLTSICFYLSLAGDVDAALAIARSDSSATVRGRAYMRILDAIVCRGDGDNASVRTVLAAASGNAEWARPSLLSAIAKWRLRDGNVDAAFDVLSQIPSEAARVVILCEAASGMCDQGSRDVSERLLERAEAVVHRVSGSSRRPDSEQLAAKYVLAKTCSQCRNDGSCRSHAIDAYRVAMGVKEPIVTAHANWRQLFDLSRLLMELGQERKAARLADRILTSAEDEYRNGKLYQDSYSYIVAHSALLAAEFGDDKHALTIVKGASGFYVRVDGYRELVRQHARSGDVGVAVDLAMLEMPLAYQPMLLLSVVRGMMEAQGTIACWGPEQL